MTFKTIVSSGKSKLIRPLFAPGLLLQDEDLTQVVDYGRATVQTLLRAMLGGGVLCGLRVTAVFGECKQLTITLACGTALDCHGRVIDVPQPHTEQIKNDCCEPLPAQLYLSLFPAESACEPRELTGTSLEGEGETAFTRNREDWKLYISETRPAGACGCPENGGDCYASHKSGECGCNCDCNGVLLAKINITDPSGKPSASVNHGVRRFIRPALLSDPELTQAAQVSQTSGSATSTVSDSDKATADAAVVTREADAVAKREADAVAKREAEAATAAVKVEEPRASGTTRRAPKP